MILQLLIFFALIGLNGIFVAAEFAIVKVRPSQLALQSASISQKKSLEMIREVNLYLTATQVGVTMASIGLGWIGEKLIVQLLESIMLGVGISLDTVTLHSIAIPVSFLLITFLHIVFGELLPKSLAIQKPIRTLLAISLPLSLFSFIFKPFIFFLNGCNTFLMRSLNLNEGIDENALSEKELRLLVEESRATGSIGASERQLLNNVFDFEHRKVKAIMVPHGQMSMLCNRKSIEEASQVVLKEGYSRYPVYNENKDDVIGIALSKDVLKLYIANREEQLSTVIKPAFYINDNRPVSFLLEEFKKRKLQMAIVTNEWGTTLGLITLEDVLEELVGDIQDEWDEEEPIVTLSEKGYFVLGKAHIIDVNRFLKSPITNSGNHQTLAGAIMDTGNTIIEVDTQLQMDGYLIKVVKAHNGFPELVEIVQL